MDLNLVSFTDTLMGDIASNFSGVLAANGGTESWWYDYVVPVDAPDPLVNTAVAHYAITGLPNDITDSDTDSVNLFQPAIRVDKTGDTLSKIGDLVDYTITIYNDSSADTPTMYFDISDPMLGINILDIIIPNAGIGVINYTGFEIPVGASDPFGNTVSVHATIAGFPNVYDVSDSHEINLFQPGVEVIKEGDTEGIVGEIVNYNFTITNTSSSDTPDLVLESVTDDVLGGLTADALAVGGGTLAYGGSIYFTAERTALGTDPSPLVNTVTVLYHPAGFPNDVTDSDDHSVLLWYWECYDETAWAYGGNAAFPNNEVPGNKSEAWGWTNYINAEGTYTWDLYADSGGNDISEGLFVGTVVVVVSGSSVTVTYIIDTTLEQEYEISAAHLWVGTTKLPNKKGPTASPGQFPYSPVIAADGLTASYTVEGIDVEAGFWVAAHSVIEWCELIPVS